MDSNTLFNKGGGPAYPMPENEYHNVSWGMSLLDKFADTALEHMLGQQVAILKVTAEVLGQQCDDLEEASKATETLKAEIEKQLPVIYAEAARQSYMVARAMLVERDKVAADG